MRSHLSALLLCVGISAARANTFIVNSTADSGPGSLRAAITWANTNADKDFIFISIPPGGVKVITPLSALPTITSPLVIDARTHPGYAGTPLIELNGNGLVASGLQIQTRGCEVYGLAIHSFATCFLCTFMGNKILLDGGGDHIIQDNYLGLTSAGLPSAVLGGSGRAGLLMFGTTSNLIGGLGAGRNVVSGNGWPGIEIRGARRRSMSFKGTTSARMSPARAPFRTCGMAS